MDLKEQAAVAAQHDATQRRIAREGGLARLLATSRANLLNLMDAWGVPAAERDFVKISGGYDPEGGYGPQFAVVLDGNRLAGHFMPAHKECRHGHSDIDHPDGLAIVVLLDEVSETGVRKFDTARVADSSRTSGRKELQVDSLADLGRAIHGRYIEHGVLTGLVYDVQTGESLEGRVTKNGFTPKAAS